MKAQELTGIRQMGMSEVDKPSVVNATDVLLRVRYVGVCGSDVHYYETGRIGSQVVQYPYMVGHECTGVVEEVGGSVKRVKVGDEVVVEPAISCGECDQCSAGREHTCRKLKFLGCPGQIDGCLCEYIVMPEKCCFPTGGAISLKQGVLCEPFAIGVYAGRQSGIKSGQSAAILGSGPIGLSCLGALGAEGVEKVYMTDKISERVRIAREAGAVWSGNPDKENIVETIISLEGKGVDVVFECAGQQEALDEGIELLKPGGKLMVVGIPREDRVSFSIDKIRRKEITIVNVRRQNECTQKAIDLIASGSVNLDYMITHEYRFDKSKEAFDLVAGYNDGVVKALIEI